jgi:hypothetical protein
MRGSGIFGKKTPPPTSFSKILPAIFPTVLARLYGPRQVTRGFAANLPDCSRKKTPPRQIIAVFCRGPTASPSLLAAYGQFFFEKKDPSPLDYR